MIETVLTKEKPDQQIAKLKQRHFVPGFDDMTASAAETWLHINYHRLIRDVLDGTYEPMPATGFRTAKALFWSLSSPTILLPTEQGAVQCKQLNCIAPSPLPFRLLLKLIQSNVLTIWIGMFFIRR